MKKKHIYSKNVYRIYKKNNPCQLVLDWIRARCSNPRYKNYYGKGIKCLLSLDDLKDIWVRDNADSMDKPSIDRIDNDGHYTYDNCRFIEHRENSCRSSRKKIVQLSLNGERINTFNSIREAARSLDCRNGNIVNCLKGRYKKAYGFKWEYAKERNPK